MKYIFVKSFVLMMAEKWNETCYIYVLVINSPGKSSLFLQFHWTILQIIFSWRKLEVLILVYSVLCITPEKL